MPSEFWLLPWQTLPLSAFVLIQPSCHKAHCGSSTQCSDCWAGPEQLCQRETFCFIVMSKSVFLVPYREMLLCFCSFLLYMVMERGSLGRLPMALSISAPICTCQCLCFSPPLLNTLSSASWDHACLSITASYWCPK